MGLVRAAPQKNKTMNTLKENNKMNTLDGLFVIKYEPAGYTACSYCKAWLTKGNTSKLVYIKLPRYTWQESFEAYANERGFKVTWR